MLYPLSYGGVRYVFYHYPSAAGSWLAMFTCW